MSALFQPLNLGAILLNHRVVMAPLTRLRSQQPDDVPQGLNAEYYGQRASDGGLIITEATDTSEQARGYPGAPGIYTADQVRGWHRVTEAVHAKQGFIFSQIWHTGRISHSSMQPGGRLPGAPSAVVAAGNHMDRHGNVVPFETPRALSLGEIEEIIGDFRKAAEHALTAGFDGVEIHSANGYLIDQFLQDHTNRREDAYGGSIENRTRFLLEIVEQVTGVFGHDRVGVRIAPWGVSADIRDSDPEELFSHVAVELGKRKLAYLHIVEPRANQGSDTNALDPNAPDASSRFKGLFGGPVIAAGGFTQETAESLIHARHADAVAFGRLFIANPDLPERFRLGGPLNPYDRATFYGGDARGYTDYPYLDTATPDPSPNPVIP